MKKVLCFLMLLFLIVPLFAQEQGKRFLMGDMNGDDELDVKDVTELVNIITGKAGKKYIVYTIEDFLRDNGITGTIVIDGVTKSYLNGHEYVDLGLSVKWAKMNLGATTPQDFGKYYAWGETTGFNEVPTPYAEDWTGKTSSGYLGTLEKTLYSWSNYKWGNNSSSLFKYITNSSRGIVDDIETLELEDDAARANWGADWRMPTNDEVRELRNNCYWEWTVNYNGTGVTGYIVYKAKSDADKAKFSYNKPSLANSYSLSDTHIFLPAAGHYYNKALQYTNVNGYYWTSTLYYASSNDAYSLSLAYDIVFRTYYERYYGQSVRAVCK